jgi:hypothetical protein
MRRIMSGLSTLTIITGLGLVIFMVALIRLSRM